MATAKKQSTSTSKKAAPKKAASKLAPTKKAPIKKTTKATVASKKATQKKSTSSKVAYDGEYKSFRVARNSPPFTSFRITRQTVYWIILICFIIFVQLWILKLQVEVASLLEAQLVELQGPAF